MRIDKIMRVIDEHCQKDRLNDIRQNANGISVYEIAEALQLLRNNVNADVNKLFQEGKVIKICGDKIYRFYSQQHFSKITGKHLQPQTTCNYLQELLEDMQGSDDQDDPFTQLIGFETPFFPQRPAYCIRVEHFIPCCWENAVSVKVCSQRKSLCMVKNMELSIKMGSSLFSTVPIMQIMQSCCSLIFSVA